MRFRVKFAVWVEVEASEWDKAGDISSTVCDVIDGIQKSGIEGVVRVDADYETNLVEVKP